MLTVLSGIAEFERDLMLQRTAEGRARAMAEGPRFGWQAEADKAPGARGLEARVAAGEPMR
jgi:DNA invertase Pin-like site-specific DNA recombinase